MKMNIVVEKITIPPIGKIKLTKDDWTKIAKIVITEIRKCIQAGRRTDGGPLKQNAPSTQDRKRKQGKPPMSLVDEFRRFVKETAEAWNIEAGDDYAEISPSDSFTGGDPHGASFAEISEWLQEKDYVGWFGITDEAREKIRKVMAQRVREFAGEFRGSK